MSLKPSYEKQPKVLALPSKLRNVNIISQANNQSHLTSPGSISLFALPSRCTASRMKLSSLLLLPSVLLPTIYAAAFSSPQHPASSTPELEPRPDSTYNEYLHLKPLPNHQLYAGFSFTSTTSLTAYNNNHYRYFPRALAQILQYTHTRELHLRFSLGRWDEEAETDAAAERLYSRADSS